MIRQRLRILYFGLLAIFISLGFSMIAVAEYNEKGEYVYPVEKWTDPDDPYVIKLDPTDDSLNAWRDRIDPEDFPKREPGIININRYKFGPHHAGIKTFFGRPIALTPEDLQAAKVDVAIFGAPINSQVNQASGADVWGPMVVRSTFDYPFWGSAKEYMSWGEFETLINPFDELMVVDYNDINPIAWSMERSQQELRRIAYEIAETGAIPLAVGGDHSIPYGNASGIADAIGKKSFAIVHFDAHIDIGKKGFGHYFHSGLYWQRLVDNGTIDYEDIITIGNNAPSFSDAVYKWSDDVGFKRHPLHVILRDGMDKLYERVMKQLEGYDRIYITFDIDVFDMAYAPGTGSSEPTGLTPNMLFPFIRKLSASKEIVGIDVVEYNPFMDNRGQQTARLVNRVMLEFLTGIAMHKKGVDPDFIHPLVSSPGN